jgi:hypothetical protein
MNREIKFCRIGCALQMEKPRYGTRCLYLAFIAGRTLHLASHSLGAPANVHLMRIDYYFVVLTEWPKVKV